MTQHMLADATNSELGTWFQGLTFFVTLVAAVAMTWRSFTNAAEKREVSITPGAASKDELEAHKIKTSGQVVALHAKIERVQGEINKEIHNMNKEVGGISKENEIQTQRLAQIDSKLDRLIERKVH